MYDDNDADNEGTPAPKTGLDKKKLKQRVSELRMDKRVGKYISNPDQPTKGIFKAPASEQREYRKTLKQKIRNVKSGLPEE